MGENELRRSDRRVPASMTVPPCRKIMQWTLVTRRVTSSRGEATDQTQGQAVAVFTCRSAVDLSIVDAGAMYLLVTLMALPDRRIERTCATAKH